MIPMVNIVLSPYPDGVRSANMPGSAPSYWYCLIGGVGCVSQKEQGSEAVKLTGMTLQEQYFTCLGVQVLVVILNLLSVPKI